MMSSPGVNSATQVWIYAHAPTATLRTLPFPGGVDKGISVVLAFVSVDIHTVVQHYLEKFISVFVLVLEGNTRQCCVIHRACIGISKGM